jgi:Mannosylglycerate hydrolase MGH1-like glycoside hydrolase domain
MAKKTTEELRLKQPFPEGEGWKKWGPYLSERQWGTVREDYSPYGNAWEYFPHDHARSRTYRWGEDGIAGFSDCKQRLCVGLALWNTRDPILKERLFGLTNSEGNHGEDVKEIYYYLDAAPSHSYLKMLYKYPHGRYPYEQLVAENRHRGAGDPELEIIDTGLFAQNRYFDVFVEYAQSDPDDILMRITVENRGPEAAPLHVLPQVWFRNTWSWREGATKPLLSMDTPCGIRAEHRHLGVYHIYLEREPREVLFCDNESNPARLWNDFTRQGYWKDAFHERVVGDNARAVNPDRQGTKAAAWYELLVPAGERTQLQLRLAKRPATDPFASNAEIFQRRKHEVDEFYASLQEGVGSADARAVQRQAFAGMVWSKQFFHFDVPKWLNGDPAQPPPPSQRQQGRNCEWLHLNNADIISMPDKWEYPWYAAWDLAFHCIPFAHLDAQFAKEQLVLLTREWYMHPNGQIPAYEWAFGDVNPPVHAWAAWRVFQIDRKQRGDGGDLEFLERVFHKLMLNFTWWVNRKDAEGRNVFQGGFLGLDNIGVFDRSSRLPTGGHIDQADGTSWMAMYALNLMRIALELAQHRRIYEDIATKFFEHFLYIAKAMSHIGGDRQGVGLWDEQDEFFYDMLHLPDGSMQCLKVRSMVGLIPLFAVETLEPELLAKVPEFKRRLEWFLAYRPDLASLVSHWNEEGRGHRRLLSLLRGHRMKRLLKRMLDETEFLSPYGVRALSRVHADSPYVYRHDDMDLSVRYTGGESDSTLFGGNSNWRGPIWFPVNFLIIESLQRFHHYYGDEFRIECPTGSGQLLSLNEVANELATRLTKIFLRDGDGARAVFGQHPQMQADPHFRDYLLFYEYFHGDTGRGVGASHQTGWTGLVAKLLLPRYGHGLAESDDAPHTLERAEEPSAEAVAASRARRGRVRPGESR